MVSLVTGAVDQVGTAEGVLPTVGAVIGVATAAEQALSSLAGAIPFPAFPALRITDLAVGLPHAHMHPPQPDPAAPPVPLPSIGPVIPIPFFSGAMKTFINGLPAARCGDLGLGVWCGGLLPDVRGLPRLRDGLDRRRARRPHGLRHHQALHLHHPPPRPTHRSGQ
jgi:hypothetical protein